MTWKSVHCVLKRGVFRVKAIMAQSPPQVSRSPGGFWVPKGDKPPKKKKTFKPLVNKSLVLDNIVY